MWGAAFTPVAQILRKRQGLCLLLGSRTCCSFSCLAVAKMIALSALICCSSQSPLLHQSSFPKVHSAKHITQKMQIHLFQEVFFFPRGPICDMGPHVTEGWAVLTIWVMLSKHIQTYDCFRAEMEKCASTKGTLICQEVLVSNTYHLKVTAQQAGENKLWFSWIPSAVQPVFLNVPASEYKCSWEISPY